MVEIGEGCDDGNLTGQDGCDGYCRPELALCLLNQPGDVNGSGEVTATDIIALVSYVFKSGPEPVPCATMGDANCNGVVSSTDLIVLVGHIFKSGIAPCDACTDSPLACSYF
jgi:cysteine-rich repeat protein